MPSQPPLPPLLTPYLSIFPQSSLTLVTSILGATGNWLVLRFLHAALSTSASSNTAFGVEGLHNGTKKKVVFVSFVRSWEFWRTEAKRLVSILLSDSTAVLGMSKCPYFGFLAILILLRATPLLYTCNTLIPPQGLDLARLADKQQFAFIDGLSELFYTPQAAHATPGVSPAGLGSTPRATLPLRSQPGAVPGRLPAPASTTEGGSTATPGQAEPGIARKLHLSGRGTAALDALEKDIVSVIDQQRASMAEDEELLLIVDQPDLLLAATGPSMGIGATEMAEWVTGLQEVRQYLTWWCTWTTRGADRWFFYSMCMQQF